MLDRLSNLISSLEDIDLRATRADGDDLLGDAYEYLLRHVPTESGKSKGQFYTPVEVSHILAKVIDKEHAAGRDAIFMIDASKGFPKDGNKNRLRGRDIHKIVDIFTSEAELPRYAPRVPLSEIEANDYYNLNIPRHIDSSEPEDLHEPDAHLNGGIPERDIDALPDSWQVFPTLRQTLFSPFPTNAHVGWVTLRQPNLRFRRGDQPGQGNDHHAPRIAERTAHGGHDFPLQVIERRFPRSLENLFRRYAPIVQRAELLLNVEEAPHSIAEWENGAERGLQPAVYQRLKRKATS